MTNGELQLIKDRLRLKHYEKIPFEVCLSDIRALVLEIERLQELTNVQLPVAEFEKEEK